MAGRASQRNNILLLNKLLNNRESISPFTIVIDSLEQTSKPLLRIFRVRAKATGSNVIYVSFSPKCRIKDVTVIDGLGKTLKDLQGEIESMLRRSGRTLLMFESLNVLASSYLDSLATFLASFITPSVNMVAVYHSDVTYPYHRPTLEAPEPLKLLRYIATTLLTVKSFSHIMAEKRARDRSVMAPEFGLAEASEGIIISTSNNCQSKFVIEMEYRRRSGRGIREWFLVSSRSRDDKNGTAQEKDMSEYGQITLLASHPLMRPEKGHDERKDGGMETLDTTFNLQLTDKQRSDRDEVNLPYFDAQREEGIGEGGRILYEMGVEDDFDDEEDEI